jgi:hypothetical protein
MAHPFMSGQAHSSVGAASGSVQMVQELLIKANSIVSSSLVDYDGSWMNESKQMYLSAAERLEDASSAGRLEEVNKAIRKELLLWVKRQ